MKIVFVFCFFADVLRALYTHTRGQSVVKIITRTRPRTKTVREIPRAIGAAAAHRIINMVEAKTSV